MTEAKKKPRRKIPLHVMAEWFRVGPDHIFGGTFLCEVCGGHFTLDWMSPWPRVWLPCHTEPGTILDCNDRTVCRLCMRQWRGHYVLLALRLRHEFRKEMIHLGTRPIELVDRP